MESTGVPQFLQMVLSRIRHEKDGIYPICHQGFPFLVTCTSSSLGAPWKENYGKGALPLLLEGAAEAAAASSL